MKIPDKPIGPDLPGKVTQKSTAPIEPAKVDAGRTVQSTTTDEQDTRKPGEHHEVGMLAFAAPTGVLPGEVDSRAHDRLADLTALSDAAFREAMDSPTVPMPTGDRDVAAPKALASTAQVVEVVQAYARRHGQDKLEQLVRDGRIIEVFRSAYREAFGVEPVASSDLSLAGLVRDFAHKLVEYSERPLKLTVAGSDPDIDQGALQRFFGAILTELDTAGLDRSTSVLGGFNVVGASKALYNAAYAHPEVQRLGIMAGEGVAEEVADVHAGAMAGVKHGDEAPLYWELAGAGVLVAPAANASGRAQLKYHLREGGIAVVPGGFGKTAEAEQPANRNLLVLEDAAKNPEAAGKRAARFIMDRHRERMATDASPFHDWLRLQDASGEIVDVENWAAMCAAKVRIRQLLGATRDRMLENGIPKSQVMPELQTLATEIARKTVSIDPTRENVLWREQVKTAFLAAGTTAATMAKSGKLDVLLENWFADENRREAPAYFESHTGSLPELVETIDPKADYTFNTSRYVDFRLDPLTKTFLSQGDLVPEVFVGSSAELDDYYRAKGFEFVHTARRTHGLEFKILRNRDGVRLVVQGVDCRQRLIQLGAFLKSYGLEPRPDMVRGELARFRGLNRDLLGLEIGALDKPIAGVVLGNSEQAVDALGRMAGLPPGSLSRRTSTHRVGPFEFKAVEVLPAGSDKWHVLLCFEPALGDLTQDAIETCAKLGARSFMTAGDAESLRSIDRVGAVHQISGLIDGDERIAWDDIPGVHVIDAPGAAPADNYASVSPMEQDTRWAKKAVSSGAGNTDQEGAALFAGFRTAVERNPGDYYVQPTLFMRDVVGLGAIESGEHAPGQADATRDLCSHFLRKLGLGLLRTADGDVGRIKGAKPGLGHQASAPLDLDEIGLEVPDLTTMADSQVASTVGQFKGQKRSLIIDCATFSGDDKERLSTFLRGLDPALYWVVLDVDNEHHGEINDLARGLEFETIVLGTTADLVERRLQASPNFFLKRSSPGDKQTARAEFLRDGTLDEDPNPSTNYVVQVSGNPASATSHTIALSGSGSERIGQICETVMAEPRAALARLEKAINWRRKRLGYEPARFYDSAQLQEFFAGRSAHIWSTASRLSWEDIEAEGTERAEHLIEVDSLLEKPSEVVQVTGATAYGGEGIVQEVMSRDDRGFDVLGALTENTGVEALELMQAFDELPGDWQAAMLATDLGVKIKDYLTPLAKDGFAAKPELVARARELLATPDKDKPAKLAELRASKVPGLATAVECIFADKVRWEPSDRIGHYTMVAISWIGQGRQLLSRVAKPFHGEVTAIAGGGILAEQLRMQFAMGVPTHLMDGLEPSDAALAKGKTSAGASVDLAEKHPAHAFRTLHGYLERKGLLKRFERLQSRAEKMNIDISTVDGVVELTKVTAT